MKLYALRKFFVLSTSAVISLFVLPASSSQAAPLDAATKCQVKKLNDTGKLSQCRFKAEATAIKKTQNADYGKCVSKFEDKWRKADDKAGPGVCPRAGEELPVGKQVGDYVGDITAAIHPSAGRFQACGDGTVADNMTGLMWSQFDKNGGVTDVSKAYTWSHPDDDATDPDGTLFTVFLHAMNNCAATPPDDVSAGGFAGYCDWRIPQATELFAIHSDDNQPYCIDESVFGLIPSLNYMWSATTWAGFPDSALTHALEHIALGPCANLHTGLLKTNAILGSARAVRRGGCPRLVSAPLPGG